MSQDFAKTFPIGPTIAYFNGVRVGTPMANAAIKYTREDVSQRADFFGVDIAGYRTFTGLEVTLAVADLKLTQLRQLLNRASSRSARTTLSGDIYTATTSHVFRYKQDVTLSGTAFTTLDGAAFDSANIIVYKSDYSNGPDGYTKGTDWSGTAANGTVGRIAAGDISDQDTVVVEYQTSANAAVLGWGGALEDIEGALWLTHEMNDGKLLQIKVWRAKVIGDTEMTINMKEQYGGTAITFRAFADVSKTKGKALCEIAIES